MLQIGSRLEHYMDLLAARQRIVAGNIANADTPGYRTQDIDFHEEFMRGELNAAPAPVEVQGLLVKGDGNNVHLDRESRLLAENAIRFQIASTLVRGEIKGLRSAIREGA